MLERAIDFEYFVEEHAYKLDTLVAYEQNWNYLQDVGKFLIIDKRGHNYPHDRV